MWLGTAVIDLYKCLHQQPMCFLMFQLLISKLEKKNLSASEKENIMKVGRLLPEVFMKVFIIMNITFHLPSDVVMFINFHIYDNCKFQAMLSWRLSSFYCYYNHLHFSILIVRALTFIFGALRIKLLLWLLLNNFLSQTAEITKICTHNFMQFYTKKSLLTLFIQIVYLLAYYNFVFQFKTLKSLSNNIESIKKEVELAAMTAKSKQSPSQARQLVCWSLPSSRHCLLWLVFVLYNVMRWWKCKYGAL